MRNCCQFRDFFYLKKHKRMKIKNSINHLMKIRFIFILSCLAMGSLLANGPEKLNPLTDNVSEYTLPNSRHSESSGASVTHYQTKGIERTFKMFISSYLGDCVRVTNMVNAGYYTINDIPNIVEVYNSCFE